ncbi:cytochrome c3 family protein [Lignipirellula cremea]|uniref:Cytochrome c7-like domain-containing protein n=1 Tax=Lignipirellula cremea TaxID=2528010 RepID=A0A518E1X1_9BACT|nr:cytochrome c3 family protein [Lignipirellula cremea]QDU98090.1 hypothetical protein Pla8534_59510 [Lignipirellula cremea]
MPQIFHPSMNTVARVSIFGAAFVVAGALGLLMLIVRSPYVTEVGVVRDQPAPFSHKHHVGDIGLDCRYCHTAAEDSSFAGVPPTKTCMNCHSQLFTDSVLLEPVRESFRTGEPLAWTRVHDLPDFAYFDHSIHLHKGVACVTCHGPVNEMPLMWRENTLHMQWCLDCHRHPEDFVGLREEVFSPLAEPLAVRTGDIDAAHDLLETYMIKSKTSCSTCHR